MHQSITAHLLLGSVVATTGLHGQKPPIDSSVYANWPSVGGGAAISADGKYVKYTIENQPAGSRTLVLQATDARWRLDVPGVNAVGAVLTPDSRRAVFLQPRDSLGIVLLGRSEIAYIPKVRSFKLPADGAGEWFAYQVTGPTRELIVRNFRTGRQHTYPRVMEYVFSDNGAVLVLRTEADPKSGGRQVLQWVRLAEGTPWPIWRGEQARNLVFDATGTRLAFTAEGMRNGQLDVSFWYYRAGTDTAVRLADRTSAALEDGMRLERIERFSRDGRRLFVQVQEPAGSGPRPGAAPVHVWSYTDPKLQSQQVHELGAKSYLAVIALDGRRLIRLQQDDEYVMYDGDGSAVDDFGLTEAQRAGSGEENWNPGFQVPPYLVSMKDGTRIPIPSAPRAGGALTRSPGGKYLIYYDRTQQDFFTYEVASGITRNITQGLTATWQRLYSGEDRPSAAHSARGVAAWLHGDAAVLLYDRYDLWRVDPLGQQPAVNLTNGYGSRHKLVFSLALDREARRAIAPQERLLLAAFNVHTKDSGFYRLVLGKGGDPTRLSMGPYLYDGGSPMKAQDAEMYLVRRMSATESPNYFSTADFKTFTRLSDLHPERQYNWLTTELHTWTMLDGRPSQGVLYKPENFDSTQRYPVIFHYYERKSDGLNAYPRPEALTGGCNINIPSYVSRGYLVFTPDIHFTVGETGESVLNAVVSAGRYLAKMPWVDATKLGIQGCSFGGFGTNYLVTHANLFAAAASAASVSDYISSYGALYANGASRQGTHEVGQHRIGASLWEKPDLYIKNSPVLQADRVTTPLLLMHATNDGGVPFAQAVEFFTALRRLGKKAWLLQYDEGSHGLGGAPRSIADFSVRMAQFFDHYLKGGPPPKWMTRGIPARLRGIDDGLALDHEIPTPGPGLVADDGDRAVSSESGRAASP